MTGTSIVTLNLGRHSHLLRLLEGLAKGEPPEECIVVEMGGDAPPLPALPFPVRRMTIDGGRLPLAAARNAGVAEASGELILCLDVDCIPSAGLVAGFARVLAERDGLVCCAVRYLPAGAVIDGWREAHLRRVGRLHPARVFPGSGIAEVENAGLFWSLAFGIRRGTFARIGGFDPGFVGYGAEDTDFAFRARDLGVPLLFAGGFEAYHQHHAAYDPPLQHFSDIVANAQRFRARHGIWPMEGWLDAFAAMGLIERDDRLDVIREPTSQEIAAARLPDDRAF